MALHYSEMESGVSPLSVEVLIPRTPSTGNKRKLEMSKENKTTVLT